MEYVIFSQTPAILSELFNYNLDLDLHRKYFDNNQIKFKYNQPSLNVLKMVGYI